VSDTEPRPRGCLCTWEFGDTKCPVHPTCSECGAPNPAPELAARLEALRPLVEACDAIPDITLSKWACNLGGYWEPVRVALRAARLAQGLDVDAPIMSGFDSNGWLFARLDAPAVER